MWCGAEGNRLGNHSEGQGDGRMGAAVFLNLDGQMRSAAATAQTRQEGGKETRKKRKRELGLQRSPPKAACWNLEVPRDFGPSRLMRWRFSGICLLGGSQLMLVDAANGVRGVFDWDLRTCGSGGKRVTGRTGSRLQLVEGKRVGVWVGCDAGD